METTNQASKASVELFHLLFMEQLSQKLDKRLYALKGGCNLRFFFGSMRYSEDIDIDVHTIAVDTLKNSVSKILSSTPFEYLLKTKHIHIANISTPKQTGTTQRWKIQLSVPSQSLTMNTKIEFSRREPTPNVTSSDAISEMISRELILTYKLRPIFFMHYNATAAMQQKINALILQNETQARDVFDIYHLLQTQPVNFNNLHFEKTQLKLAITNAMSISFSQFKSQVLSYLELKYQTQYDDRQLWDALVLTVCEYLGNFS